MRVVFPHISIEKQPFTWRCMNCYKWYRWLTPNGRCSRCGDGLKKPLKRPESDPIKHAQVCMTQIGKRDRARREIPALRKQAEDGIATLKRLSGDK